MNPQKPTKRLYSLKEAAQYLGLGIWSVRKKIWNGEIPYVKAGQKRILLDVRDMEAWIEKNKITY